MHKETQKGAEQASHCQHPGKDRTTLKALDVSLAQQGEATQESRVVGTKVKKKGYADESGADPVWRKDAKSNTV